MVGEHMGRKSTGKHQVEPTDLGMGMHRQDLVPGNGGQGKKDQGRITKSTTRRAFPLVSFKFWVHDQKHLKCFIIWAPEPHTEPVKIRISWHGSQKYAF